MVDKNNFYIHHRVIHHRDYKQSPNENLLYIDSIENFSKFNFCFVVNEEQKKTSTGGSIGINFDRFTSTSNLGSIIDSCTHFV